MKQAVNIVEELEKLEKSAVGMEFAIIENCIEHIKRVQDDRKKSQSALKVGDVVRLKSGGPVMAVECDVGKSECVCSWFVDSEKKSSPFFKNALERVFRSVNPSEQRRETIPSGAFMREKPQVYSIRQSILNAVYDSPDSATFERLHRYNGLCLIPRAVLLDHLLELVRYGYLECYPLTFRRFFRLTEKGASQVPFKPGHADAFIYGVGSF